jgi:Mce-associated membrane protein
MSTDEIRADALQDPAQVDDATEDPAPAYDAPTDDPPAGDTRAARARRLGDRLATAARRGAALPATLAVATVAATALSGWLCAEVYEQHAEADRQQDVLAAARQSALNFTSLDYRHYDRDSKNVLKGATGDFKKQFASQTGELTKLVAANKSVSQGQVLEAGIVRSDETSARVLVVADSKVTNTAAPEGQARTYRLQLDLVLERGRWLTSDVEFVG